MTVEEYLRSLVPGLELADNVIKRCARSPKDVGLEPLQLDEDVDYITTVIDGQTVIIPRDPNSDFQMRLDYASSTVYYSVLGVFAGGGYSEQMGDVRVSKGGYTITMSDRERFKALADALRKKWGFDVEDDASTGGMYDATHLRHR